MLTTTCVAGGAAARAERGPGTTVPATRWSAPVLTQIVDDFNAWQADWKVVIVQAPAGRL